MTRKPAAKTCGPIKIEQRKTADLTPFARNSRTHSDEQIAQIAASIREFGWTNPILVDASGGVIAGHGRLRAASSLGMDEVPVIVLGHLTAAQKRALVIADNQLALNAGWNMDLLAKELQSLRAGGFKVDLIGFDPSALAALFATKAGKTDPEATPEPPADPVSVLGDVWLLGNHRVVCGDSTDTETVAKCLDGAVPHLMVTDPPYGVSYDANWRDGSATGRGKVGGGAGKNTGKVANDDRADWREAWALFPGGVAYVWHGALAASLVAESLAATGFEMRAQIIWKKDRSIIGRGHYHWAHEPCWYAVRKGATGQWNGDRKQATIWEIGRSANETGHSTQKPVECMKRPIENNSKPGDAVYEPFSGSGTTIIAGEMTGRRVHAIELNPAYVDVAIERWEQFTGKRATHEDGRRFDQVREDRRDAAIASARLAEGGFVSGSELSTRLSAMDDA